LARGTPPTAPDPLLPGTAGAEAAAGDALRITVHNSDLSFVHEPLLVGHYASLAVTGSEAAVNRLLGGKLLRALRAGDYPQDAGTVRVFNNTRLREENPWQLPRPEAVVVVGLGPEGKLSSEALMKAVANGIVSWALTMDDRREPPAELEMAATLIGSGGMNITPGQAGQLIACAAREANTRLRNVTEDAPSDPRRPETRRLPVIRRLRLVDLYLDRASEAWRALQELQAASPTEFRVDERIESADSGLERPLDSSYRGAEYDLIMATWSGEGASSQITYRVGTRRARSELQGQATQASLLAQLLRRGSREGYTRKLGRTLFQLLVPLDLVPFMASSGDAQLELDERTAAVPWELLETPRDDDHPGEREPWAIRCKLLRKLRTTDFRLQTRDATRIAGVLVLGEPACPASYPRLPGARREARAVREALERCGLQGLLKPLIASDDPRTVGADESTVIQTLLDDAWRIVHISGHGAEPCKDDPRGVVLSGGSFLGPREIKSMRVVPELVFVNCCFSGAVDAAAVVGAENVLDYSRPGFAANVATELIRIGVKCVVATGWAVDDGRAEIFARAFYTALGQGARFIDAVAQARRAAWSPDDNTWGAYQCYGDPDWRLIGELADAQRPPAPLASATPQVASVSGLKLVLRGLATRAAYQSQAQEADRGVVQELEQRFAQAWGDQGAVAESFGAAWEALGDDAKAIRWYGAARLARDGGASYRSSERLFNLQARQAWESLRDQTLAGAAGTGADAQPCAATRQRRKQHAVTQARTSLAAARKGLESLLAVAESAERLALVASVDKRLAMVHYLLGDAGAARNSILAMRKGYQRAWDAAAPATAGEAFYPAMNVLAASVALREPLPADQAAAVEALVAGRSRSAPDFWSVAAGIELDAWHALERGVLAQHADAILGQFQDLHDRVARVVNWRTLHDQLQFLVFSLRDQLPAPEAEAAARLVQQLAGFGQLRVASSH
ncbi:CHAT domain-containing protein, partial [Ramlibacter alkalitolerans]